MLKKMIANRRPGRNSLCMYHSCRPAVVTMCVKGLLFLTSLNASAQNLVPNGDFENFITCPTAPSQIAYATPWNILQNHIGTPDYFNVCASDTQVQVPANIYGYAQAASGNGYAGITLIINTLTPEYREYLATQLTTPLVAGGKYLFSMKCSLADECTKATSNLGVFFSATPPSGNNTWDPPPFTPQLSVSGMLQNKTGWDSVGMIYAATGGERYIVIGNFDSSTHTQQQSVPNGGWFNGAYVFIDDVSLSVSELPPGGGMATSGDTAICAGDSVRLYAHGSAAYAWATAAGQIISTDSVVALHPAVTTTYFVYGSVDTVSVTVFVKPLPSVWLGPDTSLCEGEELSLNVTAPADSYYWQNGSTSNSCNVNAAGTYWVRVVKDGCVNSDTIRVGYLPKPIADAGPDQSLCIGKKIALTAAPDSGTFYWNTGSRSQSIEVSTPGQYWVQVTVHGCSDTDTLIVTAQTEGCDCFAKLPSAFTPNGDYRNDVLKIVHSSGVRLEKFIICNRWGEVVFTSSNSEAGWDGTYKGKSSPQGTYFYFFDYICDRDGKRYFVKGDLILIR